MYIQEEGLAGTLMPLAPYVHEWIHCSQLVLCLRAGALDGRGISSDLCSLKYSSLDNAWVSTHLIKVDLKSENRMVPIHSADRHLFGIH